MTRTAKATSIWDFNDGLIVILNSSFTFPQVADWSKTVIAFPGEKFTVLLVLKLASTDVAAERALMIEDTKLRGASARRGKARFWASIAAWATVETLFKTSGSEVP